MTLKFDIIDPKNTDVPSYGTNPHRVEGIFEFHVWIESSDLLSPVEEFGLNWSFRQGTTHLLDKETKAIWKFGIPPGKSVIPWLAFAPLDLTKLPDGTYEVFVSFFGRGPQPILETISRTLRFDRTDTYIVTPVEISLEKRFFNIERGLLEQRNRMDALEKLVKAD